MDELHGILSAYEMRTASENPFKKEATFKETKTDKKKLKLKSTIMNIEKKMWKKLSVTPLYLYPKAHMREKVSV